jgi:hypothetical protein
MTQLMAIDNRKVPENQAARAFEGKVSFNSRNGRQFRLGLYCVEWIVAGNSRND